MNPTTPTHERPLTRAVGFTLHGRYGVLIAWPDGDAQGLREPTYWVDSTYLGRDGQTIHARQHGFRLSTVLCMCACICLGEQATDLALVQRVSQPFDHSAGLARP